MALATTAAVAAGGWAAAAYLDARFHFRKDMQAMKRLKRGEKEYARAVAEDKVNLWHVVEETCKKHWNRRAIWWRQRSYTFGEMHDECLRY
ncbi:hypothetical protein LTR40_012667, partial [Exophiala xenobiotica]